MTSSFFFVLKVYLQEFRSGARNTHEDSLASSLPTPDAATQKRREVYKRVTKVIQLQWRSLAIAVLVLIIIVLLSVVFIVVDAETLAAAHDSTLVLPWALCLVENQGNRDKCLKDVHGLAPNESLLIGTLLMLSIVGIAACLLLSPLAVLSAWKDYITSKRRLKRSQSPENPDDMTGFEEIKLSKGPITSTIPNGLRSHNVRHLTPSWLDRQSETSSPDLARSSFGQPARSSMVLDWEDRASFAESIKDTGAVERYDDVKSKE